MQGRCHGSGDAFTEEQDFSHCEFSKSQFLCSGFFTLSPEKQGKGMDREAVGSHVGSGAELEGKCRDKVRVIREVNHPPFLSLVPSKIRLHSLSFAVYSFYRETYQ